MASTELGGKWRSQSAGLVRSRKCWSVGIQPKSNHPAEPITIFLGPDDAMAFRNRYGPTRRLIAHRILAAIFLACLRMRMLVPLEKGILGKRHTGCQCDAAHRLSVTGATIPCGLCWSTTHKQLAWH